MLLIVMLLHEEIGIRGRKATGAFINRPAFSGVFSHGIRHCCPLRMALGDRAFYREGMVLNGNGGALLGVTTARQTIVGTNIRIGADGSGGVDQIENSLESVSGTFIDKDGVVLGTHTHNRGAEPDR